MMHPLLIGVACLPLLFRLVPMIVPEHYLEPYAYWNAGTLNEQDGKIETYWRNMGYWDGIDSYSEAAGTLARKLLEFADAEPGGAILDIAHGAGESLSMHLNSSRPPSHLDALTSLPSESRFAKDLIAHRHPNMETVTNFFTSSASYRPGKDLQHPLNPMRGFMGDRRPSDEGLEPLAPPYHLVYILDAIYHFRPSTAHFLSHVIHVLKPSGVIAFTDILPPSNLSPFLGHLILPPLLSVPARNLVSKTRTVEGYHELMQKIGYKNVKIEDWSDHVFPGLANHLRSRGRLWTLVAKGIEWAERGGWKFVAVRASRSAVDHRLSQD
ncbi:hypothetical protein BD324DRAFT_642561 [Kockovaella imperatae]|uniref:S-adenosyl-L-methionine-dependent methyltransferase n=1 Tax=Kockovaella imperatae TaxID=4999 RepID=A0A1Y1UEC5_9TREE|nr:hypothetical protein BD324DRAFT_642561 [Kockovaella imperatae]ORX36410.1 hypothetical protein BD324DRAFT_642561 [Kockovaella imperatae]